MATRRPLSQLPRELLRHCGSPVPYQRLYRAVLNCQIPAQQGENGRWTYNPEDVPAIASALRLVPAATAQAA